MSYYDNYNPTILELIPGEAAAFCEFGCGAGALAAAVRHNAKHSVTYTGVDVAEAALIQAAGRLDRAIALDLDQYPHWEDSPELLASRPANGFDCIIFGDVLEHLYAPEIAVDQAARWLRPGGCIIASLPNVQHWSVMLQLIKGYWPREDAGIFDRTHIRWFALDNIYQLFEHPLLAVEAVVPRIFEEEKGRSVAEFLEPLAVEYGVDPERLTNLLLPLQYVFRVRRSL